MNNVECIPLEQCVGCAACASACSADAISMGYCDGFLYPHIDAGKCVSCGRCMNVCQCVTRPEATDITDAYITVSKDREIYERSTSGGVFGTLALFFISELHGVVVGAAMLDGLDVKHIAATRVEDIHKLQGSKYVQSDTSDVYDEAFGYLSKGTPVLFSGTPCQVAGLKAFLGRDYNNLYCVDIVCHGVPSPELFKAHVKENILKGKECSGVSFRTKDKYDRYGYNLCVSYSGGKKSIPGTVDPFYRLFLKYGALREACYSCPYACCSRVGDITVGDCGNASKYRDFHPSDTVSTVYPVTQKGRVLWERVSNLFDMRVTDALYEAQANTHLNHPGARPAYRNGFFPCAASQLQKRADDCLGRVRIGVRLKEKLKRVIPEAGRKKALRALKGR